MLTTVLTFLSINSAVCLFLSWPINLLLCWLILRKTNSLMRVWSHILLQSALIDLVLSALLFLFQPMLILEKDNIFYLLNGPLALVNQTGIIIFFVGLCAFWLEFAKYAIALQFFYRWLMICRGKQLSSTKYACCLCIPAAMALFVVSTMNVGFITGGECADIQCVEFTSVHVMSRGLSMKSWENRMTGHVIICFNVLTYFTVFVANVLIWRKMHKELMPGQQQSREISRQVGRVLLVQALFPMALTLVPTILGALSIMTGALGVLDWLMVPYFQYWPALANPVATILIVRQYRHALVRKLCRHRTMAVVHVSNVQQQHRMLSTY